jgi:peptide subunit release factor 1 (eRF1)
MIAFLNRLEGSPDISTTSIYITPDMSSPEIKDFLLTLKVIAFPDELIQVFSSSKNGAALYWGNEQKYLVFPPLPIKNKVIFSGYVTEPLRLLLGTDYNIGLILVHLGSYAVGVCHGEKLISSKVGTGLVHGRHKQGGSSQARFQRRRQKQVDEFLARVCTHVHEQFSPLLDSLDYVVYGGPRHTLLQLQKTCPILKSLEDQILAVIEVPALRQRVLEATVSRVWSSQIIEWQEE